MPTKVMTPTGRRGPRSRPLGSEPKQLSPPNEQAGQLPAPADRKHVMEGGAAPPYPMAAQRQNKPGCIALIKGDDETAGQALARVAASPEFNAGVMVHEFAPTPLQGLDPGALLTRLEDQTRAVQAGDLSDLEAMLASQAQTLSAIFFSVMLRAKNNMGQFPATAETYMRLALKAQAQCRNTVETLSEMKNPRQATFVKQANIASGHQQVNNGEAHPGRAEVFQSEPNELQA